MLTVFHLSARALAILFELLNGKDKVNMSFSGLEKENKSYFSASTSQQPQQTEPAIPRALPATPEGLRDTERKRIDRLKRVLGSNDDQYQSPLPPPKKSAFTLGSNSTDNKDYTSSSSEANEASEGEIAAEEEHSRKAAQAEEDAVDAENTGSEEDPDDEDSTDDDGDGDDDDDDDDYSGGSDAGDADGDGTRSDEDSDDEDDDSDDYTDLSGFIASENSE